MNCNACGTKLDLNTKYCPECGAAVAKTNMPAAVGIPSLRTSRSSDTRKMIGWLLLTAAAVLVIVLIVKGASSSDKENSPSDMTSSPTEATVPQAPPFSGLSLHPYDLQKNPYQAKGKLLKLILNTMPVLYNGAVIQYSGPIDPTFGTRMGLMALRLDRMADEHTALYSIMGTEAGSSGGETLGQIAVELPDGKTDLRLDRAWMVEPVEPLQGTNYLGAKIQIPAVRFWRYVGEVDETEENQKATIATSPNAPETPKTNAATPTGATIAGDNPMSAPQAETNNQQPAISTTRTFMVQIATVSSQDVADILLSSLQKKGYSAAVRHEPQDSMLHVQIGPFATRQDAEAMQQRVLADGFNSIVK